MVLGPSGPCTRLGRSGGAGGGEAKLDAGEEELAPLPQVTLFGGPGGGLGAGDAVAAGDVLLDQGQDGRAVGVGGVLGGGEGVALDLDVGEAGRPGPGARVRGRDGWARWPSQARRTRSMRAGSVA